MASLPVPSQATWSLSEMIWSDSLYKEWAVDDEDWEQADAC
ncbi:hypothetical protein ACFXPW_08175 [Streptomyces goshikiensis]